MTAFLIDTFHLQIWVYDVASAVQRTDRPVVVKREQSFKAKFTLTYDHKHWVVTKGTRLHIQVVEMSFLRRIDYPGETKSRSAASPVGEEEPVEVVQVW